MTLTVGYAPFGTDPAGEFNFELPKQKGLIYFEDSPRRMRAIFAGETIVDSARAKLLHEHGHLPLHYFPEEDVRTDLLEPTDHHTHCPFKGDASYRSVRVGDRVAENAVWHYPEPLATAPWLEGYAAIYWSKMDEWLEEDEPAVVHARNPYTRVDVLDTSRHIKVLVNGETVAETSRARALFETSLPPRWYIPREDVREDMLVESDTRSGCAYKGFASYYSVEAGGERADDVVWYYTDPRPDAARVRDYLCFYNEQVDIEVDGEPQERPETKFSPNRRKAHA